MDTDNQALFEAENLRYKKIFDTCGENSWMFTYPWALGAGRYFCDFGYITNLLNIDDGGRVLDLGCGSGWISIFLAHAGFHTLGVDVSEVVVACANERASKENVPASFVCKDIQSLDYSDEFDCVIIFNALHHCVDESSVLKGACRALKPGGQLIIREPTWLHKFSPGAREVTRDAGHLEKGYFRISLSRTVKNQGFTKIRHYYEPGIIYDSGISSSVKAFFKFIGSRLGICPGMKVWITALKD